VLGRITTSGEVTEFPFTEPVTPFAITAGPGRSLWFTDHTRGEVGRVRISR
jgi:streptogramin lyase